MLFSQISCRDRQLNGQVQNRKTTRYEREKCLQVIAPEAAVEVIVRPGAFAVREHAGMDRSLSWAMSQRTYPNRPIYSPESSGVDQRISRFESPQSQRAQCVAARRCDSV